MHISIYRYISKSSTNMTPVKQNIVFDKRGRLTYDVTGTDKTTCLIDDNWLLPLNVASDMTFEIPIYQAASKI
jgi:hypothetical protein